MEVQGTKVKVITQAREYELHIEALDWRRSGFKRLEYRDKAGHFWSRNTRNEWVCADHIG